MGEGKGWMRAEGEGVGRGSGDEQRLMIDPNRTQ